MYLQKRVARFRDEWAYKELFLYFYTPLHRFAFGLMKDADDVEDVVSEIFISIWCMGEKIEKIERLDYYLFQCVKNAAFKYVQKRKTDSLNSDICSSAIDALYPADSNLNLKETSRLIENAVQNLPPQCQMVFRLAKEEAMTYKEIGLIINISENTVKTHIRIALARIRQLLNNCNKEMTIEKKK